jgi:hypothetical protein
MKRFILDEMETYIVSPVKRKAMADDFTPTAGWLDFFGLLSAPLLVCAWLTWEVRFPELSETTVFRTHGPGGRVARHSERTQPPIRIFEKRVIRTRLDREIVVFWSHNGDRRIRCEIRGEAVNDRSLAI